MIHESGRATGIRLENGKEAEADVIVVNADLVWAHNNLFKQPSEPYKPGESSKAAARQRSSRVNRSEDSLLDPKYAKRLLKKPHSSASHVAASNIADPLDSCSSISFYWAMKRTIPSLQAHNIFLVSLCSPPACTSRTQC